MKKAEIKRRKRVVAAAGSQIVEPGTTFPIDENGEELSRQGERAATPISSNGDPVHESERDAYTPMEEERPSRPVTIPVDFTEAFRKREAPVESRKRTYSASNQDDAYSHPQNVSSPENDNIDPSLPQSGPGSAVREHRRAELRREAENMRQLLIAKEKELAALGEDA
jgi:hypothetical protein